MGRTSPGCYRGYDLHGFLSVLRRQPLFTFILSEKWPWSGNFSIVLLCNVDSAAFLLSQQPFQMSAVEFLEGVGVGPRLYVAARLVSTWWGQVTPSVAVNFGFQWLGVTWLCQAGFWPLLSPSLTFTLPLPTLAREEQPHSLWGFLEHCNCLASP